MTRVCVSFSDDCDENVYYDIPDNEKIPVLLPYVESREYLSEDQSRHESDVVFFASDNGFTVVVEDIAMCDRIMIISDWTPRVISKDGRISGYQVHIPF